MAGPAVPTQDPAQRAWRALSDALAIGGLLTPALLLDVERLDANLQAMRTRLERAGVGLRPHAKTARCVEVTRRAGGGRVGPVTVATLTEARALVKAGWRDLTWAQGVAPDKLPEVIALQSQGASIGLLCDALPTALAIVQAARASGSDLRVWVEIDCGQGRAGLLPGDPHLLEIVRALQPSEGDDRPGNAAFAGLLTHAGHAYAQRGARACAEVAGQEAAALRRARDDLVAAGLPCPALSAGSTPTAVHGSDWGGVDELRPGNYAFFDLTQLWVGSCRVEDIACSVLATVIGHKRERGTLTLDAGSLALSPDSSALVLNPAFGYGLVCDLDGTPVDDLYVASLNQEHGLVRSATPGAAPDWARLPIGSKVRVLPAHACITAAMFDRYHVHRGQTLIDLWRRF